MGTTNQHICFLKHRFRQSHFLRFMISLSTALFSHNEKDVPVITRSLNGLRFAIIAVPVFIFTGCANEAIQHSTRDCTWEVALLSRQGRAPNKTDTPGTAYPIALSGGYWSFNDQPIKRISRDPAKPTRLPAGWEPIGMSTGSMEVLARRCVR